MSYNGHRNWNHWNVSLWLNNDEGNYRAMVACVKATDNRDQAAKLMLRLLPEDETPDGAPYSKTTIRAAMRGIK